MSVYLSPAPAPDWELLATAGSRRVQGQRQAAGVFTLRLEHDVFYRLALSRGDVGVRVGAVPAKYAATSLAVGMEPGVVRIECPAAREGLGPMIELRDPSGQILAWARWHPLSIIEIPYVAPGLYLLTSADRVLHGPFPVTSSAPTIIRLGESLPLSPSP